MADLLEGNDMNELDRWEHLRVICNYNAEVKRGIMHTAEWIEKIETMQSEYDADWERERLANIEYYKRFCELKKVVPT